MVGHQQLGGLVLVLLAGHEAPVLGVGEVSEVVPQRAAELLLVRAPAEPQPEVPRVRRLGPAQPRHHLLQPLGDEAAQLVLAPVRPAEPQLQLPPGQLQLLHPLHDGQLLAVVPGLQLRQCIVHTLLQYCSETTTIEGC